MNIYAKIDTKSALASLRSDQPIISKLTVGNDEYPIRLAIESPCSYEQHKDLLTDEENDSIDVESLLIEDLSLLGSCIGYQLFSSILRIFASSGWSENNEIVVSCLVDNVYLCDEIAKNIEIQEHEVDFADDVSFLFNVKTELSPTGQGVMWLPNTPQYGATHLDDKLSAVICRYRLNEKSEIEQCIVLLQTNDT